MKLADLANPRIPALAPDATLEQALFFMAEASTDLAFVISNDRPVGMVSSEELNRQVNAHNGHACVRDVMDTNALWFYGDWDAEDAVKVMSEHEARKAIVRDRNGFLLGCVDFACLIPAAARPSELITRVDEFDFGFVRLL